MWRKEDSLKNSFRLGDFELYWLNGGAFELDGGAMFGVVPKKVWQRKLTADTENFIPLVAWPILVKTPDALIMIETGLGNKLTEKQRKIFRVREEWKVLEDLAALGIKREDIMHVILTHGDFDHAGGIVTVHDTTPELTFPNAQHIIQSRDWEDIMNPNKRAINSYWSNNFEELKHSGSLELVKENKEIVKGITVARTGGHHSGHQLVRLESQGQTAVHMGDLMPTHAHFNPLWVMAYDDFPLEVIQQKEKWQKQIKDEDGWYLFYHDPHVQYCKFDEEGNVLESSR